MTRILILFAVFLMLTSPSIAVEPEEMLEDPTLEARARDISAELRCLVCQNQSIDDSDAQLAKDLRILVRARLTEGDSDDDVMSYIVSRYGDFVLLKPPLNSSTYVLWYGPIVIVCIGLFVLVMMFRRKPSTPTHQNTKSMPLNTEEQKRLDVLLTNDENNKADKV